MVLGLDSDPGTGEDPSDEVRGQGVPLMEEGPSVLPPTLTFGIGGNHPGDGFSRIVGSSTRGLTP
jgi:hypothetical protein